MLEQQVSLTSRDRNSAQGVEHRTIPWIRARRELRQPIAQTPVKSGQAGEFSLVRRSVGEIEDALHAEWRRLRDTDVPMQVRSGEGPVRTFRRVEAALIDTDPQIGATPKLRECRMDARRFTIGLECGMA